MNSEFHETVKLNLMNSEFQGNGEIISWILNLKETLK